MSPLRATNWRGSYGYAMLFSNQFNFRIRSEYLINRAASNINRSPPWKILFFGTDDYALKHLVALHQNCLGGDDKIVGRLEAVTPSIDKCDVETYATEHNLKCMKWPLKEIPRDYDVGIVISFGHLIPKKIIDAFPYGILNVHPSLLPRWRGASPVYHTILNGDEETGVSITEIRPAQFDVGPLLMQSRYSTPFNYTTNQLTDYLAVQGSKMLLNVLMDLPNLKKLEHKQTEEKAIYAHKLYRKHALVNWEKQTSSEIDRQYRALSEMYGLRSLWNGRKVKLLDKLSITEMQVAEIKSQLEKLSDLAPGGSHYLKSHQVLCIKCKDGWTGFRRIILNKSLSAKRFYNFYLYKPHLSTIPFESQENDLNSFFFNQTH